VVLRSLDGPIYLYFVTRSSSACSSFSCMDHCRVCSFLGVDSNVTDALFSIQTEILLLESFPFTCVAWGPCTRLRWAGQGRASPHRDLPAGQEHARIGEPGAISRLQEAWSWLLGTVLVTTTLSFFGQAAGGLWRASILRAAFRRCSASGPGQPALLQTTAGWAGFWLWVPCPECPARGEQSAPFLLSPSRR